MASLTQYVIYTWSEWAFDLFDANVYIKSTFFIKKNLSIMVILLTLVYKHYNFLFVLLYFALLLQYVWFITGVAGITRSREPTDWSEERRKLHLFNQPETRGSSSPPPPQPPSA